MELARRFAPSDLPILLVGPTGSGKEVLAQAIHRCSGPSGPLVDVNCGALPATMVTNELFGHRRGSYTGSTETVTGLVEAAHRGTLFLDELGSLTMDGQSALLRVVETGEVIRVGEVAKRAVSLRLIGALQGSAFNGSLRNDLAHRLAGGIIRLAPLRERPDDLWPLARDFARQLGRELDLSALPVLRGHTWPGNVRELRLSLARAVLLSSHGVLDGAAVAEAVDTRPDCLRRPGRARSTGIENSRSAIGAMPMPWCARWTSDGPRSTAASGVLGSSFGRTGAAPARYR